MESSSIDPAIRRRLERHIDNLPVLPSALVTLLALDPDGNDYYDQVIAVLESEPNFAVRLLRAANSAASSPAQPIVTLAGAVTRVGSRGAANLVLALAVTKVFVPKDPWERSLWRHGVQVAHAARALARHAADSPRLNPDEVYTCALLHDVGRFVFFQEAPEQLRAVDEGDWDTPEGLIEHELAICGISHAEVGALACRRWGLPVLIERVLSRHHDRLPEPLETVEDKVVAIVQLADLAMFPSAMADIDDPDQIPAPEALASDLHPRLPPFLRLSVAELAQIIEQAGAEADEASRALGIVS